LFIRHCTQSPLPLHTPTEQAVPDAEFVREQKPALQLPGLHSVVGQSALARHWTQSPVPLQTPLLHAVPVDAAVAVHTPEVQVLPMHSSPVAGQLTLAVHEDPKISKPLWKMLSAFSTVATIESARAAMPDFRLFAAAVRAAAAGLQALASVRLPASSGSVRGGRRKSSNGPRSGSVATVAEFALSGLAGMESSPVKSTGSSAIRSMRAIRRAQEITVRITPIVEPPFGKTSNCTGLYTE
jgi:hypothetical protein